LILAGVLGGIAYDYDTALLPVYGSLDRGRAILGLALAIIAIGSIITVIQRILHVRSQARSAAPPSNH
jgi:hypothetical protein